MSRLIDANNAISVLKILSDKCCDDKSFEQAISVLESAPTIDAVPVVRCKDCKYWNECGFGMRDDQCHCSRIDYWTNADWFCADGERRDPCSSQDS